MSCPHCAKPDSERAHRRNIMITDADHAQVKRYGDGNASLGVRVLLGIANGKGEQDDNLA